MKSKASRKRDILQIRAGSESVGFLKKIRNTEDVKIRPLGRELGFILFPCVLLLLASVWSVQRSKIQTEESNGPFRTRIRKVTLLPVTPLEKWQGFDVRVQVEADMVGTLPPAPAPVGDTASQLRGDIARRADGVREAVASLPPVPNSSPATGARAIPAPTPTVGDIVSISAPLAVRVAEPVPGLAVPDPIVFLARIPAGKKATLHGKVSGKVLCKVGKTRVSDAAWQTSRYAPDFVWTWARPAPFSISVDVQKLAELNAQVSREQVRFESAKVNSLPPRASMLRSTSGFLVGGNGETQTLFEFAPPLSVPELEASSRLWDWKFSGEMRDSRGKIVIPTQPQLPSSFANTPTEKSLLISLLPVVRYGGRRGPIWELRLPVRDVPRDRGEVFYEGLISYKDCLPRPFKIKLRSWAEITPSPALKIIRAAQNGNRIDVLVQYTGTKTLDWHIQAYDSSTKALPPLYYDYRNYFGDQIYGYGQRANTDYLVTNWSQHVEAVGKPISWSGCDVALITPLPNNVLKVTYFVPPSAEAKRIFRGEVGLKGHGFLPFSVVLGPV